MKRMIIAVIACQFGAVCAQAAQFNFSRVVDSATAVPGMAATFNSFANGAPVIDGDNLAFIGQFPGGFGYYKVVGGNLSKVADTSTTMPGGPGTFTFLSAGDIAISGSDVAFIGVRIAGGVFRGIYTDSGGTLHPIVDNNTNLPGNPSTKFAAFSSVSLDNGNVSFRSFNFTSGQEGVYTTLGGTLRTVAQAGAGGFTSLADRTQIDGDRIVFGGRLTGQTGLGVRAEIAGTLVTIADQSTPLPGGGGNFSGNTFAAVVSGTNVAFMNGNGFPFTVYADLGAGLTSIAGPGTLVAGGVIESAGSPSIDGTNLVFLATDESTQLTGIYTTLGGSLQKLIGEGDILNGFQVSQIFLSSDAISGDKIAFGVNLSGGGQAIYVATLVPEPSSIALGLLGVVSLLTTAYRRARTRGVPATITS